MPRASESQQGLKCSIAPNAPPRALADERLFYSSCHIDQNTPRLPASG